MELTDLLDGEFLEREHKRAFDKPRNKDGNINVCLKITTV